MVDDAALTGEKAEVWLRRPAAAMMRVEVLNFILILAGWLLFVKRLCCIELIIVQSDVKNIQEGVDDGRDISEKRFGIFWIRHQTDNRQTKNGVNFNTSLCSPVTCYSSHEYCPELNWFAEAE